MIHPFARDANGSVGGGLCSQMGTYRFADVSGSSGLALALPFDCKTVIVHIEAGSTMMSFSGTISGSTTALYTSSGVTLPEFPVIKESGASIVRMFSGANSGVSIFAFR
jgi:hypothetical protein